MEATITRICCETNWRWRGIDLWVVGESHDQPQRKLAVASPIAWEEASPYEANDFRSPTLSLDTPLAQSLMDDLWRCGLRPSEGSGSAGSLAATQRHLEDMRSIAFKGLGLEAK